jgi:ATP-dependent RNA helicase DHX37/DHR1
MLALGVQHGCLPYVIAMVAGLSVGDPFLREEMIEREDDTEAEGQEEDDTQRTSHIRSEEIKEKERNKSRRRAFFEAQKMHASLGNGQSDIFKLLSVVGAYEYAGGSSEFCAAHFVRMKVLQSTGLT